MQWQRGAHATVAILAMFGSVSALADTAAHQTCPVPDLSRSLGIYRLLDLTTCPQLAFPTDNRLRIFTVEECVPTHGSPPSTYDAH